MADNSSSHNIYSLMQKCFNSTIGVVNITAFAVSSIVLILPLCIFIIYLGVQRWRQRRPGQTMSHSDVFTYHMVVMEITNMSGTITACCAVFTGAFHMVMVSMDILIASSAGQTYFHLLTCVDRYLAVVHPVTYLRLRTEKGARIRNIATGCIWFLSQPLCSLRSDSSSARRRGRVQAEAVDDSRKCVVSLSLLWFYLPSSLILPLLYLQRAGKLACGKNK
ncbi:uncharacterized protein V6R79_017993 [Siganus canaliculatus]